MVDFCLSLIATGGVVAGLVWIANDFVERVLL
jgi:hypothetical protein